MAVPLRRGVFPNRLHKISDGDVTVSNAGSNILSLKINDAISVWVRQRLQEHRVNNAKDCGVRTDARRKREHGNGSKAGGVTSIRNANFKSTIIVLFSQSSHRAAE